MTTRTDLTIEQGTTWRHAWTVQVDGTDLAGTWEGRCQIRRRVGDETILATLAVTVTAPVVAIDVDPDESTGWAWSTGVYDIEIQAPDGTVFRVVEGAVTLSPEVTR